MENPSWFLIRSWHVVRTGTAAGRSDGLCGRRNFGEIVDTVPGNAKTCGTCLKILTRRNDS